MTVATISLTELIADSALLTRVDRKYLLPVSQLPELQDRLYGSARALEIDGLTWFSYRSCYHDTPGLGCYLAAGRRRRRRFKARTREYLHSSQSWLEVKTRGPRGSTVKDRIERQSNSDELSLAELSWLTRTLTDRHIDSPAAVTLIPSLITSYQRRTLQITSRDHEPPTRMTIDVGLACELPPEAPGGSLIVQFDQYAFVETKGGPRPSEADRTLWAMGYRPQGLSKYGLGVATLRPDVPALKWHHLLDVCLAA